MTMADEASKYFQQVAGNWDALCAGYLSSAVRAVAIAKAYLRPEMAVADVGAGTGFLSVGLAPLVRRVYVVDGSAAMLDQARKNLCAFNNVEFHEADGLSLPFPEESLDAVFANLYLHHTSDPLASIREMVRVLRPGGRLVITDMEAHPYGWLKEEMADVWQGFKRDQMRTWFQEAGLVNIIVDCTGQSCCAASETMENDRDVQIPLFVAVGARRMPVREAVRDSYAARANANSCSCASDAVYVIADCNVDTEHASVCSCASNAAAESCCCGSTPAETVNFVADYTPEELADAPQEAAEFSLGCGNPIALAGLKPGEVVVDIGSGGGLDSFLAAAKVGPQGRVIGVDMTPAMLERARASAERNAVTNVEFRPGYAEDLPVEDGSVDVILSNCVINLTEDKGRVFQETFRALKPGGHLEVSDVVSAGPVPFELQENSVDWSACISGALPEAEYLDLISQAGFQNVTVRRSTVSGEIGGVPLYSLIVSAQKPASA